MPSIVWRGSPNFDTNRVKIDRICIHWFGSGTLEGANSRFQNPSSKVSAHYGISDNRIWQWVKEEHVAYHSGVYSMNQRSIGIEHDANPNKPLSETSYKNSAELIKEICKRHNIKLDRKHIIAHREVKATQCPGTIDIDKIIRLASDVIITPVPEVPPMNDQTKIPLNITTVLETYGEIELGALKSKITAKDARIKELESQPAQPSPLTFKSDYSKYLWKQIEIAESAM